MKEQRQPTGELSLKRVSPWASSKNRSWEIDEIRGKGKELRLTAPEPVSPVSGRRQTIGGQGIPPAMSSQVDIPKGPPGTRPERRRWDRSGTRHQVVVMIRRLLQCGLPDDLTQFDIRKRQRLRRRGASGILAQKPLKKSSSHPKLLVLTLP